EPVWLHPADRENLTQERNPPQCVYVLHRGDFLVRACEPEIKAKFKPQAHDVLQYILVDGVFHGAVTGDFKQGPSVVEDVVLDLPETQCRARREEVLAAVRRVNDPVLSPVKRYCSRSVL
ncbi:MAG: hypothetical protein LIO46_01015, partial [Clostridiales bacterium]|nr:hypothetical protein [Clostridiales bacterium]